MWGEEDEGEKVRVFTNQSALPQERKRAEKGRRRIMLKVVCPECGGAKSSFAIACSDRGRQTGMRACSFCKGEGQVSSEAAERWRTGKALRDARVKRGLTQQQEAEWLGISPRELNAIELGRLSFEQVNTRSL
jgi:ribosome-binding protein aMBF1 (putative translation factor)